MKKFLHVGCGPATKSRTTAGFNTPDWQEVRFDIDPQARPDILGSIVDMKEIASGSFDALYSSHNIEHLYPHEVPLALAEFRRVLAPDGFAVVTCPDIQTVCRHVAEGRLLEPLYNSPMGPVSPIDILYGLRPQLAAGNLYMAHRCGFTLNSLCATLQQAGFAYISGVQRPGAYDLWALATREGLTPEDNRALVRDHLPAQ